LLVEWYRSFLGEWSCTLRSDVFQEALSMDSGTLHAVAVAAPASGVIVPAQRRSRDYLAAHESTPDEPVAVVVAGAASSGKSALIGALLGAPGAVVDVPTGTYLVIRYGQSDALSAHLPGRREPQPYAPTSAACSLVRPPRRIEMQLPHTLLRNFALIEAPCVHTLGVPGTRVLTDAAERGGAVIFVVVADRPLVRSELDLLSALASRQIAVFFAVMPPLIGAASPIVDGLGVTGFDDLGSEPGAAGKRAVAGVAVAVGDPVAAGIARHQAVVAEHVPCLAAAPWLAVDPAAGDTAYLRRALAEWAGVEALHRAGDNPAAGGGLGGTIRIAADAGGSGWGPALEHWLHANTRMVRQRLAIEVANIHLRCVQDLFFGAGCAGLPEALDRELHSLSLRVTADCDAAISAATGEVLRRVLGAVPSADVRQRVTAAVRLGVSDDPAGAELTRVLLVTGTGGVATIAGEEALAALPAYPTERPGAVVPPAGVALSGGCYSLWHRSGSDVIKARAWLQRATRAVESELLRDLSGRLEAVHRSLSGLVAESVDHGILLA
jgi:hypothetical protein